MGTRVEIEFRDLLGVKKGEHLDLIVAGTEVDVKYSGTGQWTIPREAVGKLCLVAQASEKHATFSVGLVRADEGILNPGKNQDSKRTINKTEHAHRITWLVKAGKFPRNFFYEVPAQVREQIFSREKGLQRIILFFTLVTNRIVPREIIRILGKSGDPMRRLRGPDGATGYLWARGIVLFGGTYDGEFLEGFGLPQIENTEWISVPITDLTAPNKAELLGRYATAANLPPPPVPAGQ